MTNAASVDVPSRAELLLDAVRKFAQQVVGPLTAATQQDWAGAAIRQACISGLAGIEVPKDLGGLGLPFSIRAQVAEAMACVDFAFAFAFINHHNAILRIAESGSPIARATYVPAMLRGKLIGCTAMSESAAGSDFTAIAMRAHKVDGGWQLTGEKQWVANARGAELALVFAQTGSARGAAGIACFIVDLRARQCRRTQDQPLEGLALAGIGGFVLDACFVPECDVLYPPGDGFRQAMAGVNKARVHIAAMACGMLHSGLQKATSYSASRIVFGQPVFNQQGLRWSLVNAAMKLEILQMLTQRAANLIDDGSDEAVNAAATAKLYAGSESLSAIADCMQALGAQGLTQEQGFARRLMAARALCLADGSNEIMRDRLGSSLVRRFAFSQRAPATTVASVQGPSNPSPKPMLRALYITRSEIGTNQCSLRTLGVGDLPDAEVLVRVNYSTLNYKDGLAITGRSPVVRKFPMVPGVDFAGVVERSADGRYQLGDAVLLNGWGVGETHWGGLAQYAAAKGDWLIPLPEAMSAQQAMSIGTAGYTAMLCVMALEEHGVSPDAGPVLVTGANGGVGTIAIALLAHLGYTVTASTGRIDQIEYLKTLGASGIVERSTLSGPGKPLQKESWAAAIDCVGGHTLANVLATTRYGGVVAACGLVQSMDLPTSVAPFILRGVSLVGIDSVYAPRERRIAAWRRLTSELNPAVVERNTSVIGLTEVLSTALALLAGQVRGRIVVDVNR